MDKKGWFRLAGGLTLAGLVTYGYWSIPIEGLFYEKIPFTASVASPSEKSLYEMSSYSEKTTVPYTVTSADSEEYSEQMDEEETSEEGKSASPELFSSGLELVSVTARVKNGSMASLTVRGIPGTEYDIEVIYPSGPSSSKSLSPSVADETGTVCWKWRVGANTKTGSHTVRVSGGGETLELSFETYKDPSS